MSAKLSTPFKLFHLLFSTGITPITRLLAAMRRDLRSGRAELDTDRTFAVTWENGTRVEIEGAIPRLIVNGEDALHLRALDRLTLYYFRRSIVKTYRRDNRNALRELARTI